MPTTTLTAASVERLKTPTAGQIEYYDRRLPSFGVRLSYHGTKSWFVMTRLDGKLIRVTLGRYPCALLGRCARRGAACRQPRRSWQGPTPDQVRRKTETARGAP